MILRSCAIDTHPLFNGQRSFALYRRNHLLFQYVYHRNRFPAQCSSDHRIQNFVHRRIFLGCASDGSGLFHRAEVEQPGRHRNMERNALLCGPGIVRGQIAFLDDNCASGDRFGNLQLD